MAGWGTCKAFITPLIVIKQFTLLPVKITAIKNQMKDQGLVRNK